MQFDTQWYCMGMVLKEAAMYKMVDNFDTIWGPIGVTSDVNLNCLPILLLELSQFECVFNTLSNLLTRVHNRHNRHNGI